MCVYVCLIFFPLALLPQVFVNLFGSRDPPTPCSSLLLRPSLMPAFFSPGNQALMHPQEVCALEEATPRRLLLTWFLGPWHSGGARGQGTGTWGQTWSFPAIQNSSCYS